MNGRSKRTSEEPCDGPISDRHLLGQFVDHDDEDAFAQLVSRYCGLVLGVCRRTLRDEHSAEDAFQATFLVLARRASRIRNRSSLAGWLYAVAYRTALRANAKRHRRREEALQDDMTATDDIFAQVTSRHEQQLLDEELHRLPAKYREPLVLRYLMGKSNKQIAGEMGLTVGVVEGRLKRGKDRLRLSLVRRGMSLTAALAAVGLSAGVLEAAEADSLVAATVHAAAAFRSGAQPAGDFSQSAVRLAEQELAMSTSAVAATTSGVAVTLLVVGLTFGLGSDAGQQQAQAESAEIAAAADAALPATVPADGREVPVRFVVAEARKSGSKPAKAVKTQARRLSELRPDEAVRAALAERRRALALAQNDRLVSAETKIEEALGESATFEFIDTPLADVSDTIKDMHQIQILIDKRALADVGVRPDDPVTFELRDITLQSGLNHILHELDLTWIIRDEVLLITTPEEAENALVTRLYEVGDLVTYVDKSGEQWADYDTLIELITTIVEPNTWEEVGGPGAIVPAPFRGAEMLVVSQTCQVHLQIARLLDQLRALAKEKGGDEPPIREKPEGYGGWMGRDGRFGGMWPPGTRGARGKEPPAGPAPTGEPSDTAEEKLGVQY